MDVENLASTRQPKLFSIQYLRAVAALLVVFHHAHNNTPWLYNPLAHYSADARGVDIFFAISGFIMYTAARKESAGTFIKRRLIRIAPLYWLATFAFMMLANQFTAITLFQSLFFIPFYNPDYVGRILPILIPGWTLNYEMFFYVVFALALLSRRLIPVLIAVIVTLVIFGSFYDTPNALWRTYTNPMLLEFVGGVVIALAFERFKHQRDAWHFAVCTLPVAIIALLASDIIPLPLIIRVGLPAMMIVGGVAGLEISGRIPDLPTARLIGDASYAIYLTHIIVVGFCGIAVKASGLLGISQFLVMMTLSIVASIAFGIVIHRTIEMPIVRLLNRPRSKGRFDAQAPLHV